jgi:hypothetical protein
MILDNEGGLSQKPRRLTVVGSCIIVTGISPALVVGLWLWIGYIGPSYSANLLIKQQERSVEY